MDDGEFDDAAPYLEKLLDLQKAKPYDIYFAHFSLCQIHFNAGRWSKAQKHVDAALSMGGEDPFLLMISGQVLCAQGKHVKAREALDTAIKLKPGDSTLLLCLATCMCFQKDYEEAEEIFRRLRKKEKDSYEPHVGLAQCLVAQHRWDEARKVLDKAKERFPTVLVIRQVIKDLEKIDQLEEFYNSMLEDGVEDIIDDEWPNLPYELARTAMAEMRFPAVAISGAKQLWDDYLRIGQKLPRSPEVWAAGIVYTLSRIYDLGDISQAELARRFEVSAGGVSRVFRVFSEELKIAFHDSRYRKKPK